MHRGGCYKQPGVRFFRPVSGRSPPGVRAACPQKPRSLDVRNDKILTGFLPARGDRLTRRWKVFPHTPARPRRGSIVFPTRFDKRCCGR